MPPPTSPTGGRSSRVRAPRRFGALLALALALALCSIVLSREPGVIALLVTACALGVGSMFGLRGRRTAAAATANQPPEARPVVQAHPELGDRPDLTEQLDRLHETYVERVNLVVAEGREDLVQELSDAYMEEALRLLTSP